MTRNEAYWERRAAQRMFELLQSAEDTADIISKVYLKASRYLSFQMQSVFERFMTKHKLTEPEARRLLGMVQDKASLKELIRQLKNSDMAREKAEFIRNLEASAYQARIERMQQLQNQIDLTMQQVYEQEKQVSTAFYADLANEAYYRSMFDIQQRAGLGYSFAHIDPKQIDRVLGSKWSGKNYSKRIWGNTKALAQDLKEELLIDLLTGRTEFEVSKILANKFAQGASNARRLVRTESCYLSNQMEMESYKKSGIEKYRFVATLDLRTSKICASLDGQLFLVSEQRVGKNCPPMHPWCRSTTIAHISDEDFARMQRRARDPETGKTYLVPATMNYQEWYGKYVRGKSELRKTPIGTAENRERYSKFSDRFQEYNNGQKDTITIRRLMNNLNKSEIGKETVAYISDHPELNIQMCYNIDHAPGIRGYQDKNVIVIYASETRTVQNTAETLVHEITHHRYDIGDSQWAECVCFAQEMKHRTGKSKLTGNDLKDIIKTVKELYPDMPWR